ncbi:hypothetical protein [Saccharomonospora xinjiangensis]|uniref:CYTH domain-containing protein n=1 Tax=Saccharomonospora xinjiangensis XJ-54 TaxID=882086 RepID=I0V5V7_9PSEU|nr:hypothetical protein [Saccharomonospora xinjiangensis]EID55510.1 hypothetical protein SacxiDRAFT_3306 [Saccharomonospora xinjiangensis XJ-54]
MNTIEVERKRALTDATVLTARLLKGGYRDAGASIEVDTYYSRPDRDFLSTVECLRGRQRAGFAETEVMADDPVAAATLLDQTERQLGLTEHPVVSLPYRDLVLRHEQMMPFTAGTLSGRA